MIIKVFLKSQVVNLVCLQETKIKEMSQRMVKSLGVGRFLCWGVVNAIRTVGSLLEY